MKHLAKHLQHEGSLLIFGRGYNYATALEAALKVKEVAIMHRWELHASQSSAVLDDDDRRQARWLCSCPPPADNWPSSRRNLQCHKVTY
jgi:hypothetical protein